MKKFRILLMSMAVMIAVAGAFVTNANNAKPNFATAYGFVLDTNPSQSGNQSACLQGTLVQSNACTATSGTRCTVSFDDYPTTNAFNTTGTAPNCAGERFINP